MTAKEISAHLDALNLRSYEGIDHIRRTETLPSEFQQRTPYNRAEIQSLTERFSQYAGKSDEGNEEQSVNPLALSRDLRRVAANLEADYRNAQDAAASAADGAQDRSEEG